MIHIIVTITIKMTTHLIVSPIPPRKPWKKFPKPVVASLTAPPVAVMTSDAACPKLLTTFSGKLNFRHHVSLYIRTILLTEMLMLNEGWQEIILQQNLSNIDNYFGRSKLLKAFSGRFVTLELHSN